MEIVFALQKEFLALAVINVNLNILVIQKMVELVHVNKILKKFKFFTNLNR